VVSVYAVWCFSAVLEVAECDTIRELFQGEASSLFQYNENTRINNH